MSYGNGNCINSQWPADIGADTDFQTARIHINLCRSARSQSSTGYPPVIARVLMAPGSTSTLDPSVMTVRQSRMVRMVEEEKVIGEGCRWILRLCVDPGGPGPQTPGT